RRLTPTPTQTRRDSPMTHYAAQIELLAEKAVRRIQREIVGASAETISRSHAHAVRNAQEGLERFTRSSHAAQQMHNRINALMVERGMVRWNGAALVAA